MAFPLREPSQMAPARNAYPPLNASTFSALNEKLIEVVSLLHGGALSDAQLRELTACIAVQTANTEKLHKFALSNADEPAFAVRMTSGDRS